MKNLSIDDLRPGDKVWVYMGGKKEIGTVLAKLSPISVLLTTGQVIQMSEIDSLYEVNLDSFQDAVDYSVRDQFLKYGLTAPTYEDLAIGDLIAYFDENGVKIWTVAVMDVDHQMIFNQDGRLLRLEDPALVRLNWQNKSTKFLTDQGEEILRHTYE